MTCRSSGVSRTEKFCRASVFFFLPQFLSFGLSQVEFERWSFLGLVFAIAKNCSICVSIDESGYG